MGRKIICIVVIVAASMGCRRDIQKTASGSGVTGYYALVEKYEIAEGPHAGFIGNSTYTIRVRDDSTRHALLFENIANAYTVRGIQNGDSVILPTQKFPFRRDSVIISGAGKFSGDSLFIKLFSGGPAGRITSDCKATRLNMR